MIRTEFGKTKHYYNFNYANYLQNNLHIILEYNNFQYRQQKSHKKLNYLVFFSKIIFYDCLPVCALGDGELPDTGGWTIERCCGGMPIGGSGRPPIIIGW